MFEVIPELTIENILSRIDEYSIFRAYCPNFTQIGKKFIAELNRTEKEIMPSAIISSHKGRLWYKDFGNSDKAMDCFSYIQAKYGMSFIQSLGIVNLDFNLGLQPYEIHRPSLNYVGLPESKLLKGNMSSEFTTIEPKHRRWHKSDVEYWNGNYFIEKSTLEFFKVKPLEWYLLNGMYIPAEKYTYSYLVDVESGICRQYYKIYSPFSKNFKWISNCKSHHYQGYNQLPLSGDLLIITKSLKDVMLLYSLGYNSIAPGSEAHKIEDDFLRLLKMRFGRIILFFDNDEAGIKGARRISYHTGLESIIIPKEKGAKDISDFVKNEGKLSSGVQLMNDLL